MGYHISDANSYIVYVHFGACPPCLALRGSCKQFSGARGGPLHLPNPVLQLHSLLEQALLTPKSAQGHWRWHTRHPHRQEGICLPMAKALHHIHQPFRLRNHPSSYDLREAAIQPPCRIHNRARRHSGVPAKICQNTHRKRRESCYGS